MPWDESMNILQYLGGFLFPPLLTRVSLFLDEEKEIYKEKKLGGTFKMAEEWDLEITFLPTNTSKRLLQVEQLLKNTYWTLAEDLRLPKRQETPHVPG